MKENELKKVFTAILELTNDVNDSDIKDIATKAKNRLLLIEWYEKYGLEFDSSYRPYEYDYQKISDDMMISYFRNAQKEKEEGRGRYISWSDDGSQPNEEWLLQLSCGTGAYIFGDDYNGQQQLFQDFFNELKSYKPDYSDTANHNLYWKFENANDIFNNYKEILQKYHTRNREELKQRKIEKLKKELETLSTPLTPQG